MNTSAISKVEYQEFGFSVLNDIYSSSEINNILHLISQIDTSHELFRKSEDLFAIRQFLKVVPQVSDFIFNERLLNIIYSVLGNGYFITKSIYFDKPEKSNWFVAYHQDLTISVNRKIEIEGYGPWTVKQNQFAVQPPLSLLESNFTIRIHLDDTTNNNGALKVIPGSHRKGVYRPESIDWNSERETVCEVKQGGIMLMNPLLLHSSARTTNNQKRRVIHIEFSKESLPHGLNWSEYQSIEMAC